MFFNSFPMAPSIASYYQMPYMGMSNMGMPNTFPQQNLLQMSPMPTNPMMPQPNMNMLGQPIYSGQPHWNEDPKSIPTPLSGQAMKENGEDWPQLPPQGPNPDFANKTPYNHLDTEPKEKVQSLVKVPMPMGL